MPLFDVTWRKCREKTGFLRASHEKIVPNIRPSVVCHVSSFWAISAQLCCAEGGQLKSLSEHKLEGDGCQVVFSFFQAAHDSTAAIALRPQ
jgi:hypothetical protein